MRCCNPACGRELFVELMAESDAEACFECDPEQFREGSMTEIAESPTVLESCFNPRCLTPVYVEYHDPALPVPLCLTCAPIYGPRLNAPPCAEACCAAYDPFAS
jgi:hypothetical protein